MSSFPPIVSRQTALDYLLGRINYERTVTVPHQGKGFRLQRMQSLLALLGNPHYNWPAVHITGTKGKGSTSLMMASILMASGYKVGLYTSPHLEHLEERFVVDGKQISSEVLVELVREIRSAVDQLDAEAEARGDLEGGPTFFEVTTAMAMLHFAREKVDIAVLEVGLGGRLDSTNVCRPIATAITSISFDHMRQLGNTLDAIAREKAGIIKPGVPMICGVLANEPREAIEAIASEQRAPLVQLGKEFEAIDLGASPSGGQLLHYREPSGREGAWELNDVELAMPGAHQVRNGAIAIAICHQLVQQGYRISPATIRQGLGSARAQARIERVNIRPAVILDVAHNVASIEALADVISQQFSAHWKILILASSRDKETSAMLGALLPLFDHVILTCYLLNPRAVEPPQLLEMARRVLSESKLPEPMLETAGSPASAYARAMALAGDEDLVCITGSFFLAGEIRPLLKR